jgi:hypothetical protein
MARTTETADKLTSHYVAMRDIMEKKEQVVFVTTSEELNRVVVAAMHSVLEARGLSVKHEKKLLSARDIESEYGIAKRTLEHWRNGGTGPEYTTVGGRIMYERVRFDKYIAAGRVRPADVARAL